MSENNDSCGKWIDEVVDVDWSDGETGVRQPKCCECGSGTVLYTVVHKTGDREFASEACLKCVVDAVSVLISCGATEIYVYHR